MKKYSFHKRQFLIGTRVLQIKEDWQSIKIEENLYLSHCPSLPVGKMEDLNGEKWYLLGIAIQTDKDKADPLTAIGTSLTGDVKELYNSWTGRWVLIGNNEVHTDCCGLLGCFYTKINEDRWISSSIAILQETGALLPRPETLKYQVGIEWYPLPTSRFEGVYKILPSQVLDLRTFYLKPRALPKPVNKLSYSEILDKIKEKLKFSILNVSGLGKEIFLALTGGYDSRVVLAATHFAEIKVKTFTRVDQGTAYSDIILPKKLSQESGYLHALIKKSKFSKEKEELYNHHVGGNIDHVIKKKFAHGQYYSPTENDIILSGGIFEVARCYYWKKMDSNLSTETIIKAMRPDSNSESYNAKALTEWIKWVKQTPTEGLDWRDRFYLEQRLAGWASSLQQALDVTDTVSLHILNCHDLISLFLSIPVEIRRTFEHHVELINQMFPSLLQYPFNSPDPIYIQLQKKLIRQVKSLSKLFASYTHI